MLIFFYFEPKGQAATHHATVSIKYLSKNLLVFNSFSKQPNEHEI